MSIDHPDFSSPLVAGSNLLYSNNAFLVPAGGQLSTGVIDVTSYAEVFVQITNPAAALCNYQVAFYGDQALTKFVGASGTWWKNGPGTLGMFLAVQGPYLNLVCNNSDGVNRNMILALSGLVAIAPAGIIYPPVQIAFNDTNGVANGAHTTVQAAPGMNVNALHFVNADHAPVQSRLEVWTGAAWQEYSFLNVTTPNLGQSEMVVLPFSDCRIVSTNLSGGLSVVQSGLMAPAL
jgi:hypothetical protein